MKVNRIHSFYKLNAEYESTYAQFSEVEKYICNLPDCKMEYSRNLKGQTEYKGDSEQKSQLSQTPVYFKNLKAVILIKLVNLTVFAYTVNFFQQLSY